MSFWTDFESFINKAALEIESDLVKIAKDIKPLVVAGFEEIATLALNAVASEAPKVLSGQEKLGNAVSTVVTSLGSQGKSISVAVAEAAVQSAYNTISALLNKGK